MFAVLGIEDTVVNKKNEISAGGSLHPTWVEEEKQSKQVQSKQVSSTGLSAPKKKTRYWTRP